LIAKTLNDLLGSVRLNEIDGYPQQNNGQDDAGIHYVAEKPRSQRGDHQNDDQGVNKQLQ
jgi:hypothetical protein